jgi:hypothetical protein
LKMRCFRDLKTEQIYDIITSRNCNGIKDSDIFGEH